MALASGRCMHRMESVWLPIVKANARCSDAPEWARRGLCLVELPMVYARRSLST